MPPTKITPGRGGRSPSLPNSREGRQTSKAPRYRPPPKIAKDIRELRSSTHLLIPQLPFGRLVRETILGMRTTDCKDIRFQASALRCLQEAAEQYIIGVFEDSYLCALHSKRVTLMAKDLRLAYKIRGDYLQYE